MMFDEWTVREGADEESSDAESPTKGGVSRRAALRLGPVGAAGAATATALGDLLFYQETFPTSPLILSPFNDELPIPKALAPEKMLEVASWAYTPGPGDGQQNSLRNERHQLWSSDVNSPDPIVYK